MNQAERKYFLKKFLSFNSSFNSSNGSIDNIKMNILQNSSPPPTTMLKTDSTEIDCLLQSSPPTMPITTTNKQFNLLQQQNSLELKPFEKKDIQQIVDQSNPAINSFKTDITFLDNQSVTSAAVNQQQLWQYQQIFKLPNNGLYNKLKYKLVYL